MKNVRTVAVPVLACLLMAVGLALPSQAQVKSYKDIKTPPMPQWEIPKPERLVLKNGMVVFLMEDHELPLIEVAATVRAGSRLDPADKIGLASIVGEVLRTGGTAKMSGDEIDAFLESRGAFVETGMGTSSGSASMSCLKEDFDKVLPIFADVLMSPRFDGDKIELSKVQARSAISRRNDDPADMARREFNKLIWGADSAYARHPEYATIDAISQEDLKAYHKAYYKPNAIILGVTGDFDSKSMAAKIKSAFGSWKQGEVKVPSKFAYQEAPNPGVFEIEKNDVTQSVVRIGHKGLRYDHPDYYAAQVLNELFGLGFSSRIVQSVRSDKGLAYSVGSALTANYDHPGVFVMVMSTKSGTTVEGIRALYEELDRLYSEPPTQAEVDQAKSSLLNSFVFNFDDEGEIMNRYMTYEYYGYPLNFLDRYQGEVEKVTPADVLRVAKEHVHKENTTVLVAGKVSDFDAPLASLTQGPDSPWGSKPVQIASLNVAIPEPAVEAPKATAASLDHGRQVLQRVTNDLGGADKVLAVGGMKLGATRTMSTPMGEMSMKTTSWVSYPGNFRVQMQTPQGEITMVMNETGGTVKTPMGDQPMPDSMQNEMRADLVRHPVNLARLFSAGKAEGQYLGSETVAGAKCDVVLVTSDGSKPFKVYANEKSGRILKIAYQGQGPTGAPAATEMLLSDYREVDGIPVPHKYVVMQDGEQASSVAVESVEMGEFDAGMFSTEG